MVRAVQSSSQNANASAPIEVRRMPGGVSNDHGSVRSAAQESKRVGLFERGVRWVSFLLVKIFWEIAGFFYSRPEEPPSPEPEPIAEPRENEENLLEGTTIDMRSLLQYCKNVQSSHQPPVDDADLYLAFERLVEAWEKKWIYEKYGRGIRLSLGEWLTCWSEKDRLERNIRVGKEYVKQTPSVLIYYLTQALEKELQPRSQ